MNPASAWKEDIVYNGEWLAWGVFKENVFFFQPELLADGVLQATWRQHTWEYREDNYLMIGPLRLHASKGKKIHYHAVITS